MFNAVIASSVILTVFLLSAVCLCSAGDQGDFDVCVSVRQRDSPRVNNINSTSQASLPGKMGPRGPRGFKGDVGPPGECVCDQQRLNEMQSEIDRLKNFNNEIKPLLTLLRFNQNPETCSVGIKSGRVPDSALTSSSSHAKLLSHGAQFSRLDNSYTIATNAGAWVAGKGRVGEWIQVDLGTPTTITAIVTQGRNKIYQWITSFRISYGNSTNSLRFVQNEQGTDKIFKGNEDRVSYKVNLFVPKITTRYFRLYVVAYHGDASLRMELLTC